VRFSHSFRPHRVADCSYKDHFTNSVKASSRAVSFRLFIVVTSASAQAQKHTVEHRKPFAPLTEI
jgi:hypothetical protein